MPRTARWMGPGISTRDLRNPEVNVRIGLAYLRYLLDRYDGDLRLALLAYNRGPGTVEGVLRRGGDPDNGFVEMVTRVP
jgi:soluble lytic murein transglycosylase-like protein